MPVTAPSAVTTGENSSPFTYLIATITGSIRLLDVSLYSDYGSFLQAVGVKDMYEHEWPEQQLIIRESSADIGG